MSKRHILYAVATVLVVIVIVSMVRGKGADAPVFESVSVERGTVSHVVSVTGHLEPVTRINLAFPTGGRIASIPVSEGQQVSKGEVLMSLDAAVGTANLREAEAQLNRQRAVLADLRAPLRSEEQALQDTTVQNAERTLATARESVFVTIARVFVQADDAIREEADELFDTNADGTADFGVTFTYGTTEYILKADTQTEVELSADRTAITPMLATMEARAQMSDLEPLGALEKTDTELEFIEQFLSKLATAVNRYVFEDSLEQTVYESFQTSVATARTTIYTARAAVSASIKEYEAAEAALATALKTHDVSLAGATNEAIAIQEAATAAAAEGVSSAQARVNDMFLSAPIAGTVSRVDSEIGEVVAPYQNVVELLTQGLYEIEVFIPEVDIASVKLGDKANITFDAFENSDVFTGEVVRMALSETFREGVPTYKTTLVLLDSPNEALVLRPGMTADVDVLTDAQTDVLFVPTRSVVHEADKTYVRVFDGNEFQKQYIETGLRGSAGTIEVVSGLTEGEDIVLFVEEP